MLRSDSNHFGLNGIEPVWIDSPLGNQMSFNQFNDIKLADPNSQINHWDNAVEFTGALVDQV